MKRLWLLAALAGATIVQADYFGEYFDANPMPLTGTVNGAGDIDLVWPAADQICKTQILKNGVLLDATEDFDYTDTDYQEDDTYSLVFQACRNHVHEDPSNIFVPGDDPVSPVEDLDCDATNATFVVNGGNPVQFGGGPYTVSMEWTNGDGSYAGTPPVTGLSVSTGSISFVSTSGAHPANNYLWTVPASGTDTDISFSYGEQAPGVQCDTGSIVTLEDSDDPPVMDTGGLANLSVRKELDTGSNFAAAGIEGFGRNTVGGRNGQHIIVDTLSCAVNAGDGVTSFPEAVAGNAAKVVTFDVGGLINCGNATTLQVGANTTVLGSTAPFPGIHIGLLQLSNKNVSQVILQGFQVLGTDPTGQAMPTSASGQGTRGRGISGAATGSNLNNIVWMNMSATGQTDDNNVFTGPGAAGNAFNITMQDNMVFEGDSCSSHPESWCAMNPTDPNYAVRKDTYYHSMGSGANSTDRGDVNRYSMIGGFMAHNGFRNPIIRGVDRFEVIGATTYNPRARGFDFWQNPSNGIVRNNLAKRGPNTKTNQTNLWNVVGTNIQSDSNTLQTANGASSAAPTKTGSPGFAASTDIEADYRCSGPRFWDSNMERVTNEFLNGTGEVGILTFGNPLVSDGDPGRHWKTNPNFYPSTTHPNGYDTDGDGIQDSWELANGGAVGPDNANSDFDGDGIPFLEEFAMDLLRSGTMARGCGS